MKKKLWLKNNIDTSMLDLQKLNILKLTSLVLASRNYNTTDLALDFLSLENSLLNDPFLLKDMQNAIDIINENITKKIVIYGDYDVDGVTSTSVLVRYFKSIGVNVDYYIPERMAEGYGLNVDAISQIANDGANLLITVDCGITSVNEVAHAKSLGLTVIITDHHSCKDLLPVADAIINPKQPDCSYPYKELAGVGVAFKLICAHSGNSQKMLNDYSDIVALGTIADVMPLNFENRLIVSRGITKMSITDNLGLKILLEEAQVVAPSSGSIGFRVAPRINAAGRMGKASDAVKLLLTDDESIARKIAVELCEQNTDRQEEEQQILLEALLQIEENLDFTKDKVIISYGENWHHGVIGIVSSRVTERYYLPSIILSVEGETAKGSSRSIKGFNMFEALNECSELLDKFGGHSMAAGLSLNVKNIPLFKNKMLSIANSITKDILTPTLKVDAFVDFKDINIKEIQALSMLEPYGISNPQPVFASENLEIVKLSEISGGKHTKLLVSDGKISFDAMCFSKTIADLHIKLGDFVDLAYTLDVNDYRNTLNVSLLIRDIRPAQNKRTIEDNSLKAYDDFKNGENLSFDLKALLTPERTDFVSVYRFIKTLPQCFNLLDVSRDLSIDCGKLLICLDCFKDANLITLDRLDDIILVKFLQTKNQVSLTDTHTFLTLTKE